MVTCRRGEVDRSPRGQGEEAGGQGERQSSYGSRSSPHLLCYISTHVMFMLHDIRTQVSFEC